MRTKNPHPTVEYLHECFDLQHDTGKLIWKKRPLSHFLNQHGMRIHHAKFAGKEAGSIFIGGRGFSPRLTVALAGYGKILCHRIVWLLSGKEIPDGMQVDHKDLNALNNHIDNLRLATNQMNNANSARKSYLGKERHLPKGVYPNGPGKWQAKIKVNYKTYCLGTYDSPEKASEAYFEAAKRFFGEFARKD